MPSAIIFNDISPFIGRFHPLFVHLPIGFIIVAYVLEFASSSKKRFHLKAAVPFVLWLGGISGVLAAVTGYILAQSGGYGAEAIFWHQWSGIAVTILVFITLLVYKTKAYRTLFSFTMAGILITGHLGGNLTHGETYLTEYLPDELKDVFGIEGDTYIVEVVSYQEAALYKHLVYPILHDKCVSCHNNTKLKGELNIKDFDAFLKGGENGEVVKKGSSKTSEMIKRIQLSESHEDTMPPEGKERITEEELQLISLWIDQDLKEVTPLDSIEISQDLKEDIQFRLNRKEDVISPVFELDIAEASEDKLEDLRAFGFNVLPVARDSPFLQVTYFDRVSPLTEESKKALLAVSKQLVWLDLTSVLNANDDWVFLEALPNLVKLYLSNTSVEDNTIIAFSKNKYLEKVSLFGTSASKEILKPLLELEYLEYLYLGNSKVHAKDTISMGLKTTTKIIF